MKPSSNTTQKKALLIVLGLVMSLALVPAFAFAENDGANADGKTSETSELAKVATGDATDEVATLDAAVETATLDAVDEVSEASVAYQVPTFINKNHPELGMTWSTKYCADYTVLTPDLKNWSDQWIVVTGDISTSEIVVSGTVNLILTDGCSLDVYKRYKQAIRVPEGATLNIYGQENSTGFLKATSHNGGAGIGGAYHENSGAINIYGGTINARAEVGLGGEDPGAGIGGGTSSKGCNIAIYGGSVTASSDYGTGIGGGKYGGCEAIKIYGGSVYATGGTNSAAIGSGANTVASKYIYAYKIYIYGGHIEATSSMDAAAIGGGYYGDAYGLYLYGGEVIATSGDHASGFGGGREGSCDGIYINGGTYTCKTASKATGIGCGFKDTAKNIYISGGTINITGTEEGAAIGCSYGGSVENINISGGVLNVSGGSCAAAIGAGKESTAKNIQISGGTINATGGSKGAGIGSGFKGSCDGIYISGGNIVATGGIEAAGIGGSFKTEVSNIVFSGGMTTATAGDYAAAIGGGKEGVATNISFTDGVVRALCSQTGNPSISAGQKGTASNITVGDGLKVWNLADQTEIPIDGDITSRLGNFDVAITNGTIVSKGITFTLTGFSPSVSSEDQKRIESIITKANIAPSGGFKLLESQAQLAAMVLGCSEEEMTEIILNPQKTIDLSLEIQMKVESADFSNAEKPVIEFGLTTIATSVLHSGTQSKTVVKVVDPEAYKKAQGKLTVTLPVPAGVVPTSILHTSDDGSIVYDSYTSNGNPGYVYDMSIGVVMLTIDHCSHLKASYSTPENAQGYTPQTGDNTFGFLIVIIGIALCAAVVVVIARIKTKNKR